MDADRNLLFGVIALQTGFLSEAQFVDACAAWAARKNASLGGLLEDRGWLSPADRAEIDGLTARRLGRDGGDPRQSLAAVADGRVRRALEVLNDPEIDASLAGLEKVAGRVLISSIAAPPGHRDRYTLSRFHAQGGLSRVWLASDPRLGRSVALKELRPDLSGGPSLAGRLLAEARITGQLEHPGIVPIYELEAEPADGRPYYTMRFVRGRTLAEASRAYHARRASGEAGPLEFPALLQAFVRVCEAIGYAHARGVIHRDLKGANVVLGDFGEVIVLDWGLAKLVGQADDAAGDEVRVEEGASADATRIGQVLGTPAYMAPEQAAGDLGRVGRPTDVYGLGAVLYEVLTAGPPFSGTDSAEVLRLVRDEPPPHPRRAHPGVPAPLAAVCLKALEKDPNSRYRSAMDLAEEVRRWLAEEPVEAYPDRLAARARRWSRKHRTAVSTGLGTVAAAALTFAILAAFLARAYDAESRAKTKAQAAGSAETVARRNAEAALAEKRAALARERAAADRARERAARLGRYQTARLLEDGDVLGSLVPAAAVAELEEEEPGRSRVDRVRFALGLRQSPRLCRMFFPGGPVLDAALSPDGSRLATASADGSARVWDVHVGGPITPPLGHDGAAFRVVFSPDGTRIATCGEDGAARVWEVPSGRLVRTLRHDEGAIRVLEFSPGGDRLLTAGGRVYSKAEDDEVMSFLMANRMLVSLGLAGGLADPWAKPGQGGNEARVWNLETGRETILPHGEAVIAASFSPDGRRVVTGGGFGDFGYWPRHARVWDAADGRPVGVPLEHKGTVVRASFSPDGRTVLTGCLDGTARLWDATTGRPVSDPLDSGGAVRSAAFSPDGRRIVVGSAHDLSGPKRAGFQSSSRYRDPKPKPKAAGGPAPGRGGGDKAAAVADESAPGLRGEARIWDIKTGKSVGAVIRLGNAVTSAAFSPDGRNVLTGTAGPDGAAEIWEVETGRRAAPPLFHAGAVHAAAFSRAGELAVTASGDGAARVWSLIPAIEEAYSPLIHPRYVNDARFSPDGSRIATAIGHRYLDEKGEAYILDVASAKEIVKPTAILGHSGPVTDVGFSPDGRRVVTASTDRTARVWGADDGRPISPALAHDDWVFSAGFSPDGVRVATASGTGGQGKKDLLGSEGRPGSARIWDARTGGPALVGPIVPDFGKDMGLVHTARFGPDGRSLLVAGHGAGVWDAGTGALVRKFDILSKSFLHSSERGADHPVRFWATHAIWSPDGRRVLSYVGNLLQVWDLSPGTPALLTIRHDSDILHAEFSPDGMRILGSDAGRTARAWDAASGRLVVGPLVHDAEVYQASYSPDGLLIVSVSQDSSVRVWDAATGEPLAVPLRHDQVPHRAAFDFAGGRVLTIGGREVRVWDLVPDPRPSADLSATARLLACRTMDAAGRLSPLDPAELPGLWEAGQLGGPAALPDEGQTWAWHYRMARERSARRDWLGAIWHLDREIAASSSRDGLALRGHAHRELAHWAQAVDDCEAALKAGDEDGTEEIRADLAKGLVRRAGGAIAKARADALTPEAKAKIRAEADAELDRGGRIWSSLFDSHPARLDYRLGLVEGFLVYANSCLDSGRIEEAGRMEETAILLLDGASNEDKATAEAVKARLDADFNHADTLQKLDRSREAIGILEGVTTRTTGSDRRDARLRRAEILARLGDHGEALSAAKSVTLGMEYSLTDYYRAAVIAAVAARAARADGRLVAAERDRLSEEYAAWAVRILLKASLLTTRPDEVIARIKKYPDLESLADRDDFRRLISELQAPSTPVPPR